MIAGSALVALVVGLIWMGIMKCSASCITWTFILLTLCLLVGLTYLSYDSALEFEE
jgi:hypothetical protein